MSIEEDYFIPVRAGSATDITNLAGGANTTQIDDVKYLRDKLFSALKVPMSYLSRGDGADEDKATLAQKDIRFARTIQRLQRSVVSELEKIAIVHLFTLGYRGNDLLSFKIALNNPSKLSELQELEHWKSRFDAADAASQGYFSRRWVAKNILNVSEQEFDRMQTEMFYDRKHDFKLEQVGEAAAAEAGGGGGGLGDIGGDMGGGAPDLDAGMEEPGEAGAPEEEGALLATPGEPGAEAGPPAPEAEAPTPEPPPGKRDRRDGGTQSWRASAGLANVGTETSVWPGRKDLRIYRGINESLGSNYYDEEEKKLFKETSEVKKLIDSLEKMTNEV